MLILREKTNEVGTEQKWRFTIQLLNLTKQKSGTTEQFILLSRLQVNATDVSFLLACLARSFSGGRHPPSTPTNLSVKGTNKIFKSNNFKKEPIKILVIQMEKGYYLLLCDVHDRGG
jgi:hypothetical protein